MPDVIDCIIPERLIVAKIQNVGVGNYIRDPRGAYATNGARQILKIDANYGNSFLCYPVKSYESGMATINYSTHQFIPIDTEVEQVSP